MERQLLTLCVLFLLCRNVRSWPEQDCSADEFVCGYNDPCAPTRCNSTTTKYPGVTDMMYVECQGDDLDQCTENICPWPSVFDATDRRCEGPAGKPARCYFRRYSCDSEHYNPCYPSKCNYFGTPHYPGLWHSQWITCGDNNQCISHQCPQGQWFHLISGECRPISEFTGCQNTFTYRNNSGIATSGYHAWYHASLQDCRNDCLMDWRCVGYNYWHTQHMPAGFQHTPTCTLVFYYGAYLSQYPGWHIESYERNGCIPDLRTTYPEWVKTTEW